MIGGWWVQQGSRTKLRTEGTKVNPRETIATLRLWLTERVKQQYIRNLTHVWLYLVGEREYGNSCFLQRLESLRLKFWIFVVFKFYQVYHRWFPPPLNPRLFSIFVSGMISSCLFLVLICFVGRDRAHLNGESTLSMFAFLINASYHCAHPWMCLTLEFGLFFPSSLITSRCSCLHLLSL